MIGVGKVAVAHGIPITHVLSRIRLRYFLAALAQHGRRPQPVTAEVGVECPIDAYTKGEDEGVLVKDLAHECPIGGRI
jgi:hypothetical protein